MESIVRGSIALILHKGGTQAMKELTTTQERLGLLKDLDAELKRRYHQSLDEVLHDLYMRNVISNPDPNTDEIVRTFQSIDILRNDTESILSRYQHSNGFQEGDCHAAILGIHKLCSCEDHMEPHQQ